MNKTFSDTAECITISFLKEKSVNPLENVRIPHNRVTILPKDGNYISDMILSRILLATGMMVVSLQAERSNNILQIEFEGLKFTTSIDSSSTYLFEKFRSASLSSLLEFFGKDISLGRLFREFGESYCPNCKNLTIPGLKLSRFAECLEGLAGGIIVFSRQISTVDEIEYYSTERLVVEGYLVRAAELNLIPKTAAVVLASVNVADGVEKLEQVARGLLESGFEQISVSLFEDRQTRCKATFEYSGQPYCSNCQREVRVLDPDAKILGGLSLVELRQSSVSSVLKWWEAQRINGVDSLAKGLAYLEQVGLGKMKLDANLSEMSTGQLVKLQLARLLFLGMSDIVVVIRDVLDIFTEVEREMILKTFSILTDQGMTVIILGEWCESESIAN